MGSATRKVVIVLSLVVFAYVTAGYVLGRSQDNKSYRPLAAYSEVLDHIQRDYVDEPNLHLVTNGALHGLVDSLDAQSSYLSPLEYADYKEKSANGANSKASAGVALSKRFGYISVVATLPDSPAQKAGLQFGDILEKIAGFTTSQMALDQAQLLLTGDPGAVVRLSVIRRGKAEPQDLDITLAKLPAPRLVEDKLEGDIAYLRVPELQSGVTKQIRDELLQFQRQGARKLILDLRDCAVGENEEGVSTARLFLSSGTITTLKGQTLTPVVSAADSASVVWTAPLTVLIGPGTAGPAEIVAGAVAGNQRGETIGVRTYGAASQQKLIPLDDGSALILTVANYYTPAGKSIPAEGVAPTQEVAPPAEDLAAMKTYPPPPSSSRDDPVIKKAIQVLQSEGARKAA